MSLVKTKLKAAREALGKKQYAAAKDAAEQALAFDPVNYNACVNGGLAVVEIKKSGSETCSLASRCWS